MDFLKKAAGKDKKEEHAEQPSPSQARGENLGQGQAQTGQTAQGEGQAAKPDYIDKAFNQGAKKAGYNIDPNTREKITDAGREAYEKATGKKVPDKVSN
ncbi:hypothetical protein ESCO_006335 [Escovopsis weberi]|uniref:Uncharacterized protein n=1 Tax=Escovopsis weberi TaxID=150374 RepID=A0A0M8N5C0_ESCWE|nr:hypothetical protein ESCO_006335 [Escovopsis weberi]